MRISEVGFHSLLAVMLFATTPTVHSQRVTSEPTFVIPPVGTDSRLGEFRRAAARKVTYQIASPITAEGAFADLSPSQVGAVMAKSGSDQEMVEPPFPLGGMKAIADVLTEALGEDGRPGRYRVQLIISSEGRLKDIKEVNTPSHMFARVAEVRLSELKYKPAICKTGACDARLEIDVRLKFAD